jgi:polar amino acid transport system permease protein
MLLVGRYHEWLLQGVRTTLYLTVAAMVLALALGTLLALMRSLPFPPARWFAAAFVEYHRNTPALVQLFFWYFGMPQILPAGWQSWINQHNGEFLFAVIALGLGMGAYISEDLRSAIRAIPKFQHEAARAIGFTFLQSFRLIILPQALRLSVPVLTSRTLLLLKNSSLAMTIGVAEAVYQAKQVEAMTFRAYEAFSFITVFYLVATLSIMTAGHLWERVLRK